MTRNDIPRILPLAILMLPGPALAHAGDHGLSGFASGLLHPLTGFDHLAVMLIVGLLARTLTPRNMWIAPSLFLAVMLAGFGQGVAGTAFPLAELLIAGSVLVLGLAVALNMCAPIALMSGALSMFAFAHGYAHGSELPPGANEAHFAAGFLLTSALLHGIGFALATVASRRTTRFVGGGAAALGTAFILLS